MKTFTPSVPNYKSFWFFYNISRHFYRPKTLHTYIHIYSILLPMMIRPWLWISFIMILLGRAGTDCALLINLEALENTAIPDLNLLELDDLISEHEVCNTIQSLPSDKAPGPDGFTGRFYKACWPIIKEDIMAAVLAVWTRKFEKKNYKLNSAYITLILKKEGADQVKVVSTFGMPDVSPPLHLPSPVLALSPAATSPTRRRTPPNPSLFLICCVLPPPPPPLPLHRPSALVVALNSSARIPPTQASQMRSVVVVVGPSERYSFSPRSRRVLHLQQKEHVVQWKDVDDCSGSSKSVGHVNCVSKSVGPVKL
jgi:hypothetical protein